MMKPNSYLPERSFPNTLNGRLENNKRLNFQRFSETSLFRRACSNVKSVEDTSSFGTLDTDISSSIITFTRPRTTIENTVRSSIQSAELKNRIPARKNSVGINSILEAEIPRVACKINHEESLAKEYKNLIQSLQQSKQISLPSINFVKENELTRATLNLKVAGENCPRNPIELNKVYMNLSKKNIKEKIQSPTKAKPSESVTLSMKNNQAIKSASYDNWGTFIENPAVSRKSNKENSQTQDQKITSKTLSEFQYFGPLPYEQNVSEDDLSSITSLINENRNAESENLSLSSPPDIELDIQEVSNKIQEFDPDSSKVPSVIPSAQNFQADSSLAIANSEQCEVLKRNWSDYVNIPAVINYTSESVRNLIDVADRVISNYIIPPDDNPRTQEEMNQEEDKIVISIMRLLGVPQQLRHSIYQEALLSVQAIEELSVGSLSFFNNLIDWITSGDCGGKEDILKKLHTLAFSMEADYNERFDFWENLHQNLTIFTDAVDNAVKQNAEFSNNEQNEEEIASTTVQKCSTSEQNAAGSSHKLTNNGKSNSQLQLCAVSVQTEDTSISSFQTVGTNDITNSIECQSITSLVGSRGQNEVYPILTAEADMEEGYDGDDEINKEIEQPQFAQSTPVDFDKDSESESVLNKQPYPIRRSRCPYSIEKFPEIIEPSNHLCRLKNTKPATLGYFENLPETGTSKSITSNSNIGESNEDFASKIRARTCPLNRISRREYVNFEESEIQNDWNQKKKVMYDLQNQVKSKSSKMFPNSSIIRKKAILIPSNDSMYARVSQVSTTTVSNRSSVPNVPWKYSNSNKTGKYIAMARPKTTSHFSKCPLSTKNALNIPLYHQPGYVPPTNKKVNDKSKTKITQSSYRGQPGSKRQLQRQQSKQ